MSRLRVHKTLPQEVIDRGYAWTVDTSRDECEGDLMMIGDFLTAKFIAEDRQQPYDNLRLVTWETHPEK